MALTILYRGDLSSCNYACGYCPFAKKQSTRAQLAADKADLNRFVSWVSQQQDDISVFFTPWGEALIRGYYREAITQLSQLDHVVKVVIQTNFSCSTNWLTKVNKNKTAFWITYHPAETSLESFIQTCQQLDKLDISYSVGVVGIKENFDAIRACRKALPESRYLWINAYKREQEYYSQQEIRLLTSIDPHFMINNQTYDSFNKACRTGESVISVNGQGEITRCHFIKTRFGNIYEPGFTQSLKKRVCTNKQCACYIGYIHMPHLELEKIYGNNILERDLLRPME